MANYNEDDLIKKVLVDDLPSERRRLVGNVSLGFPREHIEALSEYFVGRLLMRNDIQIKDPPPKQYIDALLAAVEKNFDEEPSLVQVSMAISRCGTLSRFSGISTVS